MTDQETRNALTLLNALWPRKPLPPEAAAIWGAKLRPFPEADVMSVINELAGTEEWMPSLAVILRALVIEPDGETASEAFTSVWQAVGRVGAAARPDISERAHEAVRRLGGWAAICGTWKLDSMQWHRKEFVAVFDEVKQQEDRRELRAIGGGMRAIGGA